MSRGTTFLELVLVLTVIGAMAGLSLGAVRRAADVAAVIVARETFVAAIAEARSRALVEGRARVDVVSAVPSIGVRRGSPAGARWLTVPPGVEIGTVPRRDTLTLRFDAIGVGRFTSASISFARGASRRSVTVSTYGRIARR